MNKMAMIFVGSDNCDRVINFNKLYKILKIIFRSIGFCKIGVNARINTSLSRLDPSHNQKGTSHNRQTGKYIFSSHILFYHDNCTLDNHAKSVTVE